MKKAVLLVLFIVLFISVYSQENDIPVLIGDRPDQTESPFLVPKGYFQFEDGFNYENENDQVLNISYSSMLLRYGLFDHFELRLGTDYNKAKRSGFDDIRGFSPFSIGGKIHVKTEKGWIPQIAFLGHINIAKTGATDFMQKNHSTNLLLTFGHTLNNDLSLGYSFGVEFPDDINYTIGTYTLVMGYAATDQVGAFIEVYGVFSKNMTAENKVNGGITYLVNPNVQLDFAGGFGLSQYAPNNYFTFGIIYLFKPF